ncbi:hypothetical protein [Flavobacterium sp.]|uniref:hypothetical protein n=1 Tax=Flavobacterium sp. TaxID=239 RepID=UPI0025EA9B84|nr:hypothetical protein [Flavobacterium sp.]
MGIRSQLITAVWRNGWFRFSLDGKSKAGKLSYIYTNTFNLSPLTPSSETLAETVELHRT